MDARGFEVKGGTGRCWWCSRSCMEALLGSHGVMPCAEQGEVSPAQPLVGYPTES